MNKRLIPGYLFAVVVAGSIFASGAGERNPMITGFEKIGAYDTGLGEGAAEIVAYSPEAQSLYIVNAAQTSVDIIDIADPSRPTLAREIDVERYGDSANSVAVHGEYVAVAIEGNQVDAPGHIAIFDLVGEHVADIQAGVLPDMVTFSPDGNYIVVANEGEPSDDYAIDPEGSITVVDISRGARNARVMQADFRRFNNSRRALLDSGVRIYGPGASVAQDLEPEYVAVTADSRFAIVTLQENNAVAAVDLAAGEVIAVVPLGTKDHSVAGNELDASNRDGRTNLSTYPVRGFYMPDAITSIVIRGREYFLTANEGDSRDYDTFSEEARVADLVLDPDAYPDAAALQDDAVLGRLLTTTVDGDVDGDGDVDQIYSYGARSMTVWVERNGSAGLVADTGSSVGRTLARLTPRGFNANDGLNEEFDQRSDDKGAEPEAVVAGYVAGRPYAFLGLERALGGVVIFDISVPGRPELVEYVLSNDGSGGQGNDISPEGLVFIPASESPTNAPLLVASYEVSGTVAIYELTVGIR